MKKKGILIDKQKLGCRVVEFEDTLKELYGLLDCDCIDITVRKIGDSYYCIVCDDEGLLKEDIQVTAFNVDNEPALVGNLLIMSHDECGELLSLTDRDIDNIKNHVHSYKFVATGSVHGVLIDVDY